MYPMLVRDAGRVMPLRPNSRKALSPIEVNPLLMMRFVVLDPSPMFSCTVLVFSTHVPFIAEIS
jgi:hypothetical protein